MTAYTPQPRMMAPPGPSQMILPMVILGPLGLLALAAGLEVMKRDFFVGLVCCIPGASMFAFLAFCLALHVRAQRLWGWHVQTGRVPTFRNRSFLKGAAVGTLLGGGLVVSAAWLGMRLMEDPLYGTFANYAFYGAFLYGLPVLVVMAVVAGWAKRAWDRTAVPAL
ncbi:hypothetical protein [Xanthomonas translucens]|uniref:hypothetical protein n=1 Tax=Xanthomonas campestris pv. translucens TaxID=343 RepID=UPI000B226B70|nr:hypothetical protein [Xanthomonas translucens]